MNEAALLDLLQLLKQRDYSFTPVTPATHARILARPCDKPGLRDIFGWNRRFGAYDLSPELLQCLDRSHTVERDGETLKSRIRVARIGDDLFLHSAFPTIAADAVFLGPDTQRFVRFIRERLAQLGPEWILDMGAGSGAGAIAAGRLAPSARITCVDINPVALELAAINATAAGISMEFVQSSHMPVGPDLVIANPPYMMDAQKRDYRDGRGVLGGEVALDWSKQALRAMRPGGTMLLYTGASVVNGRVPLVDALDEACKQASARFMHDEIDPDVFGEELDQPAYATVERIAVIGATITKP